MNKTATKLDLDFADKLKEMEVAGTQEWIAVYYSHKTDQEDLLLYSCLISEQMQSKALSDPSWDLRFGEGFPGFCSVYKNGKRSDFYSRYPQDGVEPLILFLNHHGMKPDSLEISEEFRHYFKLFNDTANRKYIYIDSFGNEEDAIRAF